MAKKTPSTELSPLEQFALVRAGKGADKLRDQIEAGTTAAVDFEVRIKGMMSAGLPQGRTERTTPPLANLLAVILDCLPSAIRPKLEKALNTKYSNDLEDGEWPGTSPQMQQVADRLVSGLTRTRQTTQRGQITGMLTAEVLARH